MAEHNDEFGSSAPPPVPSPEGEGEGGTGDLTPMVAGASPADLEEHEAHFKHPHPAPQVPDEARKTPIFPMVLGAAMLVTLVVAWNLNSKPVAPAGPATTPEPSAAPATDTPGAAPAPAAVAETGDGGKSLKSEVDALRAELKALQDRIEALPKPAPPPDLEALNGKIADLSKSHESLAALPKKLDVIDHRIGSFDKSLAALRADVNTLKGEVKTDGEQPPADSTKPEDVSVADAAMEHGVELFKAGKYKEASDAFRKLTETHPKDARVWYYAALSRGSATKDWTGETTRLVEKGVEREKAGSPEGPKIDAVFTDLNPAFKPWLDAYRKTAKAH